MSTECKYTAAGGAFTKLLLEVFRINGALLAAGDRMTRALGLTSARWQVMGALDEGPRTVSQIARRMGLARQSVQRTVDVLREEGLLVLSDNPDHRRAKLVNLSGEGRRRLARITAIQVAWANRVGGEVAARDLEDAFRVLSRLRRTLEKRKDSPKPFEGVDAPTTMPSVAP
jgi:DNA-binding MarR family transcriptional regulator